MHRYRWPSMTPIAERSIYPVDSTADFCCCRVLATSTVVPDMVKTIHGFSLPTNLQLPTDRSDQFLKTTNLKKVIKYSSLKVPLIRSKRAFWIGARRIHQFGSSGSRANTPPISWTSAGLQLAAWCSSKRFQKIFWKSFSKDSLYRSPAFDQVKC